MTKEAEQLLAAALKGAGVGSGFSPAEIGAKVGLGKTQAEAAARDLSNAGVLVLGFDCSAQFSPEYRKHHARTTPKSAKRKRSPDA